MLKLQELRQVVLKHVLALCAEQGVDLVDLEVRLFNTDLSIQVFVDLPLGGIGIEQCVLLNKRLHPLMIEEFGDDFSLEVSSPGLDRALVTLADFRRCTGQDVQFFLRERIDGKMEIKAEVTGVDGQNVFLKNKLGDKIVPIDKIEKGKLIIA